MRLSGVEFRKSLFAGDTSFILDGSVKSFETLVRILENFRVKIKCKNKNVKFYGLVKW